MKALYYIFIFLFTTLNIGMAQNQSISTERKLEMLDSIAKNPSKGVYYIDKIEVSELTFFKKLFNNEIEPYGYGWTGKEAIILFGERYRNGISFFETKIKKEEELNESNRRN
ncbi:hypothetical protein [Parabacteroides sp. Marseille-P3160]|uniref:hypothetical protein n=1 Tax=Parabacteroides sp. Marseille-P3160 TaxID=1917887 RepID=UPI0009BB3106|nr:hypothetical protein [Parabacteroides sp. Marseille-P3160]